VEPEIWCEKVAERERSVPSTVRSKFLRLDRPGRGNFSAKRIAFEIAPSHAKRQLGVQSILGRRNLWVAMRLVRWVISAPQ
jgi:hypothetical protein